MMMSGRYMIVIFIMYFSYIPEVNTKEIERILTRVESVMSIYEGTTQSTFANIKEPQDEFQASDYITHLGKNVAENIKTQNENNKNVVRVTFEETNFTIRCDSWNILKNNSVTVERKQSISALYECNNDIKAQCLRLFGESELIHESEVICRTHSNHNSALCIHNSITGCSMPLTIILNLGSIFRMDMIGRQEPYYHNITVFRINSKFCILRTCSVSLIALR